MKLKPGDRVEVDWIDILTVPGWIPDPTELVGYPAKSVGYYVNGDSLFTRIAGTIGNDTICADVTVIPTPVIIKITKLKS